MNQPFEIKPCGPSVGAEIKGLDLSEGLGRNTAEALNNALADHGVIVFRNQSLTPEQHINFARALAPININRFF